MLASDKAPAPSINTFWQAPEHQSTLSERVGAIPAAAKNTFNKAVHHVKNAPKKELLKLALEPADILLIVLGTYFIYFETNKGMEAVNSFMLNLALNLKFVSLIETAKSVGSIFASKSYCKIAAFLLSLYLASGAAATSYQGAYSAVNGDAPFQLNFSNAGIVIGAVIILLLSAMFPAKALGDFFIHTVKAFKKTHQDEHEYDEASDWLLRLNSHTVATDKEKVARRILPLLTKLRIPEPEKFKSELDKEKAEKEFKADVIALYREAKNLPDLTRVAYPTEFKYIA